MSSFTTARAVGTAPHTARGANGAGKRQLGGGGAKASVGSGGRRRGDRSVWRRPLVFGALTRQAAQQDRRVPTRRERAHERAEAR
eukprot:5856841-Prymnesium_polylepis.1